MDHHHQLLDTKTATKVRFQEVNGDSAPKDGIVPIPTPMPVRSPSVNSKEEHETTNEVSFPKLIDGIFN